MTVVAPIDEVWALNHFAMKHWCENQRHIRPEMYMHLPGYEFGWLKDQYNMHCQFMSNEQLIYATGSDYSGELGIDGEQDVVDSN